MSTSESQSHAPLELRSFIDRVPAIAWSALPDGSLDFFSQRFRDYTGLSSDQLHGSEWKSAVHPDDIQQFETWRQTLRQSQEAGTMKVRLRRFDGEYRWFQIAVTPVHDEQANLVRWCGINTDIDDLKCSEQKVHQETGDLTITDAIPIGISVLAPDGTTLYMNPLALDRIGVTLEEVKGKVHLERACHPDDRDRVLDERRMGLSKGVPFKLEVRLRLRNGEYRWYLSQYNPLLNERGQIMRWYVTATEIDDHKRAEEALRATEFSWRQTMDNIPGFVWQLSAAGEVEVVNRQVLAYFGRDFEDIKNWTTSGILHPGDLPYAIEVTRHSFATGDPYEIEIRALRFDGVYRWFQVRGHPACDAEGRILHWYSLTTDIDDRKRAED